MESALVKNLMSITLLGSEWVLWLLIAMSILSIGVMVERAIYFRKTAVQDFTTFFNRLSSHLSARDFDRAKDLCNERITIEGQVASTAIENIDLEPEAIERLVSSRIALEKKQLDRGLMILGTLGNNTPFIGLFGTVIGIIMAFHSLAQNPAGGSAVVMAGISEALIATAVGLIVAIPAVIAFNAFQRMVKIRLTNAEAVRELVMSHAIQSHAGRHKKVV